MDKARTREEMEAFIEMLKKEKGLKSELKAVNVHNVCVGETHYVVGFSTLDEIRSAFEYATEHCDEDEYAMIFVVEQNGNGRDTLRNYMTLKEFDEEVSDFDMLKYVDVRRSYLSEDEMLRNFEDVISEAEEAKCPRNSSDLILHFYKDYRKSYNEEITDEQKERFRRHEIYLNIGAEQPSDKPWNPFNQRGYLRPVERFSLPENIDGCEFVFAVGYEPKDVY